METKKIGIVIGIAVVAVVLIAFMGIATGFFVLGPGNGDIKKFGTFSYVEGTAVEKIDGKPVVRLFSTTWCPHCIWIKETFDSTMKEYVAQGKIVAYHWEIDTGDNSLTPDMEKEVPASELAIFSKFSPGNNIPLFVFGGKYYRIGNGFESQQDLEKEKAEFRAMIEQLLKE
jgi:thiol-disulfide isomerase/thioredoxin